MNLNYNKNNKIHRILRVIINEIALLVVIFVISFCLLIYAVYLGPWLFNTVLNTSITDSEAIYYTLVSLVPVSLALLPLIKDF